MIGTTAGLECVTARKPAGGYCFIAVVQLYMVWWAYRHQRIRLLDLRTWFAAHEMVARRCQLARGHAPAYTYDELHHLVAGVGGEHVRAALRRLATQGLLTWSPTTLTFATAPDVWPEQDCRAFWSMLDGIPNHRRRVPVPRRTLRFLAGCRRRVLIATMLGHLLRCLYFRQGHCVGSGFCSASWIVTVFGVSLRNVKLARHHLAEIGWLTLIETPHWVRTRWGQKVHLNLAWPGTTSAGSHASTAPRTAPPEEFSPSQLAPLDSYQKLPEGFLHQKPAARRPAGAFSQHVPAKSPPTLRHITATGSPPHGPTPRLISGGHPGGTSHGERSLPLTVCRDGGTCASPPNPQSWRPLCRSPPPETLAGHYAARRGCGPSPAARLYGRRCVAPHLPGAGTRAHRRCGPEGHSCSCAAFTRCAGGPHAHCRPLPRWTHRESLAPRAAPWLSPGLDPRALGTSRPGTRPAALGAFSAASSPLGAASHCGPRGRA